MPTPDTKPRVLIPIVSLEPLLRSIEHCLKAAPCCPKAPDAWAWYSGERADVLKQVEAVLVEVTTP